MNNNGIGLFVGKFTAFHIGHEFYIKYFSHQCRELNLVLCSNKNDKIPIEIRKIWLENELLIIEEKNIKLHVLDEEGIPDYPLGIKVWCKAVEKLLNKKIDIIFGNDIYVKECAELFDCKYLIPDIPRSKFDVSSSLILNNGLKYYDYLTEVAKPYFNKKVLIIGPESVGK